MLRLLSVIPYVGFCFGILAFVAGLYVLVLEVMAVKGVKQFGWGQAIASLLLPVFAVVCCVSVAVGALLSAVSPELLDFFTTPVP